MTARLLSEFLGSASLKTRSGPHLAISEFVATFGLLSVVALGGKKRPDWAPVAVAAYITSAYWFTSSTSFANPAVTFARAWTDTFCGISLSSVPSFLLAQGVALAAAAALFRR